MLMKFITSQDQTFTPDVSSHRGRVHCASDAPFHKCHSTIASSPCAGSSMKMSSLQELLFGSLVDGGLVKIGVKDDEFIFDYPRSQKSIEKKPIKKLPKSKVKTH